MLYYNYKSQVEELCQQKGWGLPDYLCWNNGDDGHSPQFTASVTFLGFTFLTKDAFKSCEDAIDEAAHILLDVLPSCLQSVHSGSDPEPSAEEQKVKEAHNIARTTSSAPEFTTAASSFMQLQPDHSQNVESQGNLLTKLKAVLLHLRAMEQWNQPLLTLCHRRHLISAHNLIHYLALKEFNVDELKDDPSFRLLNLGTSNPCVHATLSAHIQLLEKKSNLPSSKESTEGFLAKNVKSNFIMPEISKMVSSNRNLLLGQLQDKGTHIMVTVGEEVTESETLIHDLLKMGTTVIRINCAHGSPTTWGQIIERVKRYSQMLEKECRVLMDLAGPKLRTGHVMDSCGFIRLKVGDLLTISRANSTSSVVGTPRVTCSSDCLFDSVKPGDPIAFDEGKLRGVITGTNSEIVVSITHAGPQGSKLGPEKSIFIPESNIKHEGLTSKDRLDLKFVADNADMLGISFARNADDIDVLRKELEKQGVGKLGLVLRIDTKDGFQNLPLILLEAMKSVNSFGVMIDRVDLGVGCGWENLVDMQDQILSMCDAAHVPVVWGSVLDRLVKKGKPTTAELSDVASGRSASCIMLNQGKHILEAVSILDITLRSSWGFDSGVFVRNSLDEWKTER